LLAVRAYVRAHNAGSGVSIAFANILLHESAVPLGSVKVVARLLQKHIWKWRWLPEHTGHHGDDKEAGRCHGCPSCAVELKFASSIYVGLITSFHFENFVESPQTNKQNT
jgi:hypothetical protein